MLLLPNTFTDLKLNFAKNWSVQGFPEYSSQILQFVNNRSMAINDSSYSASGPNGSTSSGHSEPTNFKIKAGLAQMLKGGVIMDVVNAEQVGASCPVVHCSVSLGY